MRARPCTYTVVERLPSSPVLQHQAGKSSRYREQQTATAAREIAEYKQVNTAWAHAGCIESKSAKNHIVLRATLHWSNCKVQRDGTCSGSNTYAAITLQPAMLSCCLASIPQQNGAQPSISSDIIHNITFSKEVTRLAPLDTVKGRCLL